MAIYGFKKFSRLPDETFMNNRIIMIILQAKNYNQNIFTLQSYTWR